MKHADLPWFSTLTGARGSQIPYFLSAAPGASEVPSWPLDRRSPAPTGPFGAFPKRWRC